MDVSANSEHNSALTEIKQVISIYIIVTYALAVFCISLLQACCPFTSPLDRIGTQMHFTRKCRNPKVYEDNFLSNTDIYNVLHLSKNLYGSFKASIALFDVVKHSLESRGVKQVNTIFTC